MENNMKEKVTALNDAEMMEKVTDPNDAEMKEKLTDLNGAEIKIKEKVTDLNDVEMKEKVTDSNDAVMKEEVTDSSDIEMKEKVNDPNDAEMKEKVTDSNDPAVKEVTNPNDAVIKEAVTDPNDADMKEKITGLNDAVLKENVTDPNDAIMKEKVPDSNDTEMKEKVTDENDVDSKEKVADKTTGELVPDMKITDTVNMKETVNNTNEDDKTNTETEIKEELNKKELQQVSNIDTVKGSVQDLAEDKEGNVNKADNVSIVDKQLVNETDTMNNSDKNLKDGVIANEQNSDKNTENKNPNIEKLDSEMKEDETKTLTGTNADNIKVTEESKEIVKEKDEEGTNKEEKEKVEEIKPDTELDKYWKAVVENPTDFTGWTYLLQYVEQENTLEDARKAYDSFFLHYPYCYGYWKKYSDFEKLHNHIDRAIQVFERGVAAIPLSIDLWLHYINFYIMEFGTQSESEDNIRLLYDRAVSAAGTEFRSDKLWDSYISWETNKNNLKNVTKIYDKIFTIPTQLYSHHFDSFKNQIVKHHPKDTIELDEFLKLRQEVVKAARDQHDDDGGGGEEAPPGIDAPPGMEEPQSLLGDAEEATKIQEKVIALREIVYKQNENEVSKRWYFEEAIRRPYFHVKPLERSQLKNWREYLDFEIAEGSHERVVVLFERCMIACGLYEDFWMKYAKYLEQHSVIGVRNVYKRVCQIHLTKKPYIHLAWAAFEERQGNYATAGEVLKDLEKNVTGLVMVALRRISLERRRGNHSEAEQLFEEYIRTATSTTTRSFFSIKFSRYLQKIRDNTPKARTVLKDAITYDEKNEKLFMQLLDVEYLCNPMDIDKVMELFDKAFTGDLPKATKVKLSQRRMEFLEDFGTCIKTITEAYDEHQKLVKDMTSDSKKRQADGKRETSVEKKAKLEPSNGTGDAASISHPPPPSTKPRSLMEGGASYDNQALSTHQQPPKPLMENTSSYDYGGWDAYQYQYNQYYNPNYSSYYQQQHYG